MNNRTFEWISKEEHEHSYYHQCELPPELDNDQNIIPAIVEKLKEITKIPLEPKKGAYVIRPVDGLIKFELHDYEDTSKKTEHMIVVFSNKLEKFLCSENHESDDDFLKQEDEKVRFFIQEIHKHTPADLQYVIYRYEDLVN